jgi:glutamate---cysteine ligase / carboxylate-amine ligase
MPRSRSGVPRRFRDYDDYSATVDRICRAAEIPDYTTIWWDLRLHPRLGTLELRCLDAQTSLDNVAGLVALTHCLVVHEAVTDPTSSSPSPEVIAEASFRALRDGCSARLDVDGMQRPVAEIARQALQTAHAVARTLGGEDLLEHIERILAEGNGADRQRAAHATGGMPAVLRAVAIEPDTSRVPEVAASA